MKRDNLLGFLLFLFSFVVPKQKNLMIMGGGDAKVFQGNPKYLLLYLKNNKDFSCYWSAKSKDVISELIRKRIPYINPYSISGFFILLRAKYHFIEKSSYDTYYSHRISGWFNFIQTWHAIPTKFVGVDAAIFLKENKEYMYENKFFNRFLKKIKFYSRQRYKYILSTSDYVSDIFKGAFENSNIIKTGYPRNDIFFNKDLVTEDFKKSFELDKYDRIFLYAPTFRDASLTVSPFSAKIYELDRYLKQTNSCLIIKKHPWEKNLQLTSDLTHIIDISKKDIDVQEILIHTDVLITDYSSVFFDFMSTKKPVIFYTYDYQDYLSKCRGMYYDFKQELQGPFADDEESLIDYIKSYEKWSINPDYIKKYNLVLDKFNSFQDANSSKRLIDFLYPIEK